MVFSSTVFLFLFLPIVLVLYYNPFFRSRNFRNTLLLIASLVMYGWGEPVFVFLMVLSIVLTWLWGMFLRGKAGKWILAAATLYHILVLFVFKYLSFVAKELGLLLGKGQFSIQIALPIGISFFTFQLMSYLFDVYYHKAEPQKNPLHVGLYVALFPQLIAGPIVRYNEIEKQIVHRTDNWENVTQGMSRFIIGLGKKVLIANYIAQIADNAFDFLAVRSVAMAWYGAIAYALQIYFDFSGYSDMAIGLGRMFGFRFSENFNYPYVAKSITDFWRRWHISLSTWFRDYVYIPLGGNRVKKSRWIMNLFVVWLLTGIWHGANWTFIVWGLLYFVFLLAEKLLGTEKKMGFLSRICTLAAVVVLWSVFRAESISAAMNYVGNLFGIGAKGLVDHTVIEYVRNTFPIFLAAVIGCTPCIRKMGDFLRVRNLDWAVSIGTAAVFILSILRVIGSTYNPFIYFNF